MRPPMGWNSYDCFGVTVTEEEVKANARYMAQHLLGHGWEYVVIDMGWYSPVEPGAWSPAPGARMEMDEFGRLWPAPGMFPSSTGDRGFKPIADYVHSLGLKFGVHLMRGTTFQAVEENTRVLGTDLRIADIADTNSKCNWCPFNCGIDPDARGAQAYYDSVYQLLAEWEVDFVKVDDIAEPFHGREVEMIRTAISNCGREIVLSLSPGPAKVENAQELNRLADMWRVSADFWDRWEDLLMAFEHAGTWVGHGAPGHWPDLDMLPLGRIAIRQHPLNSPDRRTRFTHEEQVMMLTLWCIARSPLMLGGNLPDNTAADLDLITNDEVLAVLESGKASRQVRRAGETAIWTAQADQGGCYVAIFNLGPNSATVQVNLTDLGMVGRHAVSDLWQRKHIGDVSDSITADVPSHGAKLYRLEAL